MQFLSEIDGFKHLGDVKVIGATNRLDILDPAIIRPGRLDRILEVPVPGKDGIRDIYKIHTSKMHLQKDIDLEELSKASKGMSGAQVKSVCTEAGYFAIRDNRHIIDTTDFASAIKKVKTDDKNQNHHRMYG